MLDLQWMMTETARVVAVTSVTTIEVFEYREI